MLRENSAKINRALRLTDIVIVACSFFLAYVARSRWDGALVPLMPLSDHLFLLYIILPLWIVLLAVTGTYGSIRTKTLYQTIKPLVKTTFIGGAAVITIIFIFKLDYISRGFLLFFLLISAMSLSSLRVFILALTHYIRKKGFNFRTVLIVGTSSRAVAYAEVLEQHKEWGEKVVGFLELTDNNSKTDDMKIIGNIRDLKAIITTLQVDEVVFIVPRKWLDRIEEPIIICEQVGIKSSVAADFYPHTIANVRLEELMGWPLLVFNPTHRLDESLAVKRAMDIVIAAMALMLTLPLFLLASILVKLSSPGPVFFRQERCGLNGRRFNLLKFRTMVDDADGLKDKLAHLNEMSGPVFKIKKDPRVTTVGRFLRKYSLDELPQLINVLNGDMSIVGPRPPIPAEVEKYEAWQRRRLSVRPGITCFWQVNGRNKLGFDDWINLDLKYIDNWSFTQDLKIILKTIPAVLKGTGV